MSRRWILIALATVTAVLGAACGGGDAGGPPRGRPRRAPSPTGRHVPIALISDVQDAFDPEGVLVGHVGVLPVLPAANAALVQRPDDGRGRERARPDLAAEHARRLRRRPHVDVHVEAGHRVRPAAAGRDGDVTGLRARDGARGVRHVQRGRVLVLLLGDRRVRRVRSGRRRCHLRPRDAGRHDPRA